MNHLSRLLAVVAGVAGLVAALAGLLRELSLASDDALAWPTSSWWTDLTVEGGDAAAVAAAVAAGLTVLFLVLAVRQVTAGDDTAVSRVPAGEGAAVSVEALQRLVARRLRDAVPGVDPVAVRLRRSEEGWHVHVIADLPAEDLTGLQTGAARVADAELRQTAGRGVSSLELEARRFVRRAR